MAEVRVYQTTDRTPLSTLRDDILTHVQDVFPMFRSLVENVSIYNDEKEEILFFTGAGTLTYVKFIRSDRDGSLDYVIDDYMRVKERWARFCKNNAPYASRADETIALIVIAERFDTAFVRRVQFISTMPVTLLEVRALKSSAGEIAYSLMNVYSHAVVERGDIAKKSDVPLSSEAAPVPSKQQDIAEDVASQASGTDKGSVEEPTREPAVDESTITVTREEVAALQSSGARKEIISDFFERAQLNAEEEREFFLLNQQLSETVQH